MTHMASFGLLLGTLSLLLGLLLSTPPDGSEGSV